MPFVQAYADYYTMMDLSEEIIRACADAVNGKQVIEYQGESLDLGNPFRRATMHELVEQALGKPVAFAAFSGRQKRYRLPGTLKLI